MPVIANSAAILSALVIATTAFIHFRGKGGTLAEAGAYGLMAMLMLWSWIAQLLLLCGLQRFMLAALLLPAIPAAARLIGVGPIVGREARIVANFTRAHPLPVSVFTCGGLCLLGFTVWNELVRGPVSFAETYPALARGDAPFFALLRASGSHAATGLNHVIFMADWQPLVAAPLANSCAYLAVTLGTYALARRYAWPLTAVTATLLIASMPRLVHQNLAARSELLPAAAALLVLLALFRTVEKPQAEDGMMLLAAIGFSVTEGPLCLLMPTVLTALSIMVLSRRHNLRLWRHTLGSRWGCAAVAVAALAIFSQGIGIGHNLLHALPWSGTLPGADILFNSGGIVGTAANMIRYLLQSLHLPGFVDDALHWLFGWRIADALGMVHQQAVMAWAGGKGAAESFCLNWAPDNSWTWFGPVGFLLVIPAMVHALWSGPHRLKTTALAMLAYWLLIALIAAWRPANVRLLTPMFVCSGLFTAFFLPPWRIGRTGCRMLQWFSLAMVVYALLTYPGHSLL